jgi:CspA family cold shock protein
LIARDDRAEEAFVGISAVERAEIRPLREGERLSFERIADGKTGRMSAEKLAIAA